MSFEPVMQAVKDNPELLEELKAAKTPKERAAILDAHGIEKPHAESEFPEMRGAGGSGGGTTSPPSIPVLAGTAADTF
ncbi:MAG: Nif11 family protein [Solirubrobacteraceae bacterium]|nr:Nif11 family protein [Solirubrobacteraceae bacterium]